MPTFEITAPDGTKYRVNGPDGATEEQALEQVRQQHAAAPVSTTEDVLRSGAGGVGKGFIGLAGLPGDLRQLGGNITDAVAGKLGISPETTEKFKSTAQTVGGFVPMANAIALGPTSADIKGAVEGATSKFAEPQTTAGKYAQNVGEFAPGLIGGGGTGALVRRGITQVLAPGVASEAAGQATEGKATEPYARIAAALATGALPTVARRIITPLPVNAERAAAANTLRGEGVTDITAGQVTGRKGLQYLEAERGAGTTLGENAAEQFTSAALRRVGENATRATPEVVDRAFTRIGGEFDRLAAGNTARVDQQLGNELSREVGDYFNLVSPPNRSPAVTNYAREVIEAAQRNGGNIPGDVYQSLRSRMERAARSMGNNPEARTAVRGMREALDDTMERSIVAAGNPADIAAWQQARQQYRNLLVIEKAATGAGEGAAAGLISPAKLREATVSTQGRRNYARGEGDFADLARSGNAIMTPLPNSGTAGRLAAQNLGTGTSSIVGALLGGGAGSLAGPLGGGVGGAVGAMAGAALPRAVGHTVTSELMRRYLSNQVMPGVNAVDPRQAALINALMASGQQRLPPPQ